MDRSEIQKRFDETMADLELKHREALKNAQKDGNNDMEKMIAEFEQVKSKLKERISSLQEK